MSRAALLLAALLGACGPTPAQDAGIAADAGPPHALLSASRVLHISSFNAEASFGSLRQNGYLVTLAAVNEYATIPLPAGAILERATVYYSVVDGAVRPSVRRMDLATGTIIPVWLGYTDVTDAEIEEQSVNLGLTVPASSVLWVEVLMTGPQNKLYGARFEYREAPRRRPRDAPRTAPARRARRGDRRRPEPGLATRGRRRTLDRSKRSKMER